MRNPLVDYCSTVSAPEDDGRVPGSTRGPLAVLRNGKDLYTGVMGIDTICRDGYIGGQYTSNLNSKDGSTELTFAF